MRHACFELTAEAVSRCRLQGAAAAGDARLQGAPVDAECAPQFAVALDRARDETAPEVQAGRRGQLSLAVWVACFEGADVDAAVGPLQLPAS